MKILPPDRLPVTNALIVGILVLIFVLLLPLALGGGTSYVIVAGNSMEPTFHLGDLVLVRSSAYYGIGDVVVYRHPQIDAVFHRIIQLDGDRYILKGDNNAWIDTYHPTSDEIMGKLWAHIPKMGSLVTFLRKPFVFILLFITTGAVIMTSKETKKKKKAPAGWLNKEGSFNEAIFIAALLGFGSIILAFVAFTRPVKTPVLESYIYQHETDFFYTGEADPDIYDLTTIQPGEPIFRSVTDQFDVALTYTFNSAYEHELTGYYQLYMLIGDESGWRRKLMLLDAQTFAEDSFTAEATVDINEIQAIIDRYELASGISHTAYQVSVIADTTVEGTLNGSPLDDHITASMDFLMDEQHLYLRDRNDEDSGLTDIIVEAIDVTAQKPNMLKILNISVSVLAARIISFIGIILFGGLFVFVLFRAEQASKEDIAAHNRMVYGRWIVDVMTPEAIIDAETTIFVDKMEDLVKIAERLDTMILHTIRDETHQYVINAGSMRYLLVIEEPNQAIGSENSGADSSSGRGA